MECYISVEQLNKKQTHLFIV